MDDIPYPCDTKIGFMPAYEGDGIVMQRPHKARGTVQPQSSPTLLCGRGGGAGVVTNELGNLRIRYLTPRECFRLMGFSEDEIDKLMKAVPSKTNLYKLAGNSIVVDCLEAIFKAIYIDRSFDPVKPKQKSLSEFSFRAVNPIVGRMPEDVSIDSEEDP